MTITLASHPKLLTTYGWSSRLGDTLRLGTLTIPVPPPPLRRFPMPHYSTPEERANHVVQAGLILDAIKEARDRGVASPHIFP